MLGHNDKVFFTRTQTQNSEFYLNWLSLIVLDHYYCKYAIIMYYAKEIEQKAIQPLIDNHHIFKI